MLSGARRFWLVVVLWLCVLVCYVPAQAEAKTVHVLGGSFGSEGTGPGQFKEPLGVAVNNRTQDVYVVDSGNNRVEEFSSTGHEHCMNTLVNYGSVLSVRFSGPTLIAVDNSNNPLDPSDGDVYVVDSGHGVIDKFTETGTYVSQLTGRCEAEKESLPCGKSKFIPFTKDKSGIVGVAVDQAGMLWVDELSGRIYKFGDGEVNEYISSYETIYGGGLGPFAVDSEDNLYMKIWAR